MKKGFMTLLIITLVLITVFVACSGNARTSNRSGCGGCGLGCAACTACIAAGCALSCARGFYDTAQDVYTGVDYH
ncbi:MAG: hypothetical protein II049_07525 [Clostridia bacterium]|nr:hypothetical protein [Clostridia bacterium]